MEVQKSEIDYNTCPESVLFIRLYVSNLAYQNLAHIEQRNKEKVEELYQQNHQFQLQLGSHLTRFGIENPIITDRKEKGAKTLSKKGRYWYGKWFVYFQQLPEKEQELLLSKIDEWEANPNTDLSKWHPE